VGFCCTQNPVSEDLVPPIHRYICPEEQALRNVGTWGLVSDPVYLSKVFPRA